MWSFITSFEDEHLQTAMARFSIAASVNDGAPSAAQGCASVWKRWPWRGSYTKPSLADAKLMERPFHMAFLHGRDPRDPLPSRRVPPPPQTLVTSFQLKCSTSDTDALEKLMAHWRSVKYRVCPF